MQCDIIARGLKDRGHEVIYAAVGNSRKKKYKGFPYSIYSLSIENQGSITKLINKEKPDVVYWRYNKNYFLQSVTECRIAKIPFIFSVSHINDITKYFYSNLKELLGKSIDARMYRHFIANQINSIRNFKAFKLVDGIIFQLYSQDIDKIQVPKRKVIWNSVSSSITPFTWPKPYCVWVANIKPRKQPEAFLKLSSDMTEKLKGLDFLMIGECQDEKYKDMIENTKKNSNFYYLGKQPLDTVNGILQNAICLIHTCKAEGFPNNMIQAWMQGCPTISLEYDPDNLIQNNNFGFLSGSIEQMAFDLQTISNDGKLRNEIGERSRLFAIENFLPDRMVDEVEMFLKDVVENF